MPSLITSEISKKIEDNILTLLNKQAQELVSPFSLSSPRAIGDAVQEFLSDSLPQCVPSNIVQSFEKGFQRRSMEDMAFYDTNDYYYAIDSKTHNSNTMFNMPNLISVRRLANFYRNDTNFFNILIVEYEVSNKKISYSNCHFRPIEHYSWDCLTLGALGWGQIQIANSNNLIFDDKVSRKEWMLNMCNMMELFYQEEMGKLSKRITWFQGIKDFWENHP